MFQMSHTIDGEKVHVWAIDRVTGEARYVSSASVPAGAGMGVTDPAPDSGEGDG